MKVIFSTTSLILKNMYVRNVYTYKKNSPNLMKLRLFHKFKWMHHVDMVFKKFEDLES